MIDFSKPFGTVLAGFVFWLFMGFLASAFVHDAILKRDLTDSNNRMTAALLELNSETAKSTVAMHELMDVMTCGEWEDHE